MNDLKHKTKATAKNQRLKLKVNLICIALPSKHTQQSSVIFPGNSDSQSSLCGKSQERPGQELSNQPFSSFPKTPESDGTGWLVPFQTGFILEYGEILRIIIWSFGETTEQKRALDPLVSNQLLDNLPPFTALFLQRKEEKVIIIQQVKSKHRLSITT